MSQKSITTTTSFIVSSNESLNKPPLSSGQSTGSSDNMTASETVQNNSKHLVSPPNLRNPNDMTLDLQTNAIESYLRPNQPLYHSNNNISSNQNFHHHTQHQNGHSNSGTPSPNRTIHSFHSQKKSPIQQSANGFDYADANILMPMNVKGMLLNGVSDYEVLKAWLKSIKCEEYLKYFVEQGYDVPLLTRMTPQDLTAIGCKTPAIRKKLLSEIKKLNLEDDIPDFRPHSLEKWLELLRLTGYQQRLYDEGFNSIDKVCELTWEDLEEIGITKLGHQKRLLLGIERVKRFDRQQEEQLNDSSIYDVHPNHRISLHQNNSDSRLSTLSRASARSGLFQTRSGANLDHRGLPVATVMPALKHVNNSMANMDITQHMMSTNDSAKTNTQNNFATCNTNRLSTNEKTIQSMYQANKADATLKLSDLSTTLKRNPPPLPPVRSNSLKTDNNEHFMNSSIYGNAYGVITNSNFQPSQPTSTSFLRTPKLGTLTATTNKMLTHGGHIQSVDGNSTIRSIVPIREAPLPPTPMQASGTIPERIEEEPSGVTVQNFRVPVTSADNSTLVSSALIGHQLASADEFPPPPPCQ